MHHSGPPLVRPQRPHHLSTCPAREWLVFPLSVAILLGIPCMTMIEIQIPCHPLWACRSEYAVAYVLRMLVGVRAPGRTGDA